jgi:PDZ domain
MEICPMSDTPGIDSLRQRGAPKNLVMMLVFVLGVFAGFLASAVLNGKLSPSVKPGQEPVGATPEVASEAEKLQPPKEPEMASREETPHPAGEGGSTEKEPDLVITPETRDRLMTLDFLNLLQDAELHRYRFEGETKGLRLTKIRTGSFYEKAGFRDGDVIEEVNGLAFADVEKRPKKVRDELPAASQLTFKVRRDDKTVTIRIKVAKALNP